MRVEQQESQSIGIFCHIPKTGGMTFHHMLRRYFGGTHLEGRPRVGWVYTRTDLERDLQWNPRLRSLGSHAMRPYEDFGPHGERLRWYTLLRDPVARTISHYQHQVEKMNRQEGLLEWLQRPNNQNWQVRMLSGGQDLAAAKDILTNRFACVGLIERYTEFLLLIRERMGWTKFNVTYRRVKNPARKNAIRDAILEDRDRYSDAIRESNRLDQDLFDYASRILYPPQVADFGEKRLEAELEAAFSQPSETLAERMRVWHSRAVKRIAYPALISLDRHRH